MSDSSSSGGVSVIGLLGVAFVVLKLTEVVDWSWWWVLAPFWGGLAITVAVLLGVGAFMLGGAALVALRPRPKTRVFRR